MNTPQFDDALPSDRECNDLPDDYAQHDAPDPPPPDDIGPWDPSQVRESFDKYCNLLLTALDDISANHPTIPTLAGPALLLTQYEVHLFVARTVFFAFFALKLSVCLYELADTPVGQKRAMKNSVLHHAGSQHLVDAVHSIHSILVEIASIPQDSVKVWREEPPSICVPADMFHRCV